MSMLADPCPMPSRMKENAQRKHLSDKEKLLYAPMADTGELLYDKDAVYIDIKDHQVNFSKVDPTSSNDNVTVTEGPGEAMVQSLQSLPVPIDQNLANSSISMFRGSTPINPDVDQPDRRNRRKVVFDDEQGDEEPLHDDEPGSETDGDEDEEYQVDDESSEEFETGTFVRRPETTSDVDDVDDDDDEAVDLDEISFLNVVRPGSNAAP